MTDFSIWFNSIPLILVPLLLLYVHLQHRKIDKDIKYTLGTYKKVNEALEDGTVRKMIALEEIELNAEMLGDIDSEKYKDPSDLMVLGAETLRVLREYRKDSQK